MSHPNILHDPMPEESQGYTSESYEYEQRLDALCDMQESAMHNRELDEQYWAEVESLSAIEMFEREGTKLSDLVIGWWDFANKAPDHRHWAEGVFHGFSMAVDCWSPAGEELGFLSSLLVQKGIME